MKNGKTIQELAAEIQRQQDNKRDFLIPANKVTPFINDNHLELGFKITGEENEVPFTAPLTKDGHIQLGQFCDIPKKYYDTLLNHPELLKTNVAHWMERSEEKKLIRTMDGNVRAVLSDKYRRLDNFDLAQNVLPMLLEAQASIESCEITERKIYIKAITHKVQAEVVKGDIVSAGIIISNSETGYGSLSIKPLIYRLVCSNGMIADMYAHRKYHAGKGDEMNQIEFSNDTLNAVDKAYWLKVRDLVSASLSQVTFAEIVAKMTASAEIKIQQPDKAIELVSKKFNFCETESKDMLKFLIEGGDLTNWGLANSVTRMAQDVPSYDRSTELESIGFQIMNQNWN